MRRRLLVALAPLCALAAGSFARRDDARIEGTSYGQTNLRARARVSHYARTASAWRAVARDRRDVPGGDTFGAGRAALFTTHARPDGTRVGSGVADRATTRRTLRAESGGTYIDEMLLRRDSSLARWPDRRDDPLRVWIQQGAGLEGWRPALADKVREAFAEWEDVGLPVPFVFDPDSADADVHVTWRDRFDEPISGRTIWSRDEHWWIVGANIELALRHHDGEPLDVDATRALALHEIGHLLGLDHTADPRNIMCARVSVRDLSDADRATARLLYSLPAGAIR
jgi:hypothetical protein